MIVFFFRSTTSLGLYFNLLGLLGQTVCLLNTEDALVGSSNRYVPSEEEIIVKGAFNITP